MVLGGMAGNSMLDISALAPLPSRYRIASSVRAPWTLS
jgi:hypothetical protein